MKVILKKDLEGFGKAGDELDQNTDRAKAWIKEGIAEDPREKKKKAAKREKNENAGPGAEK